MIFTMKRIPIFILTAFIMATNLFNFKSNFVYSYSESYYRVLNENVFIYSTANFDKVLFKVPYSYYVKVESVNGNTARVVYGSEQNDYPVIIGYMKFDELSTTAITPLNPFAIIKVSTSVSDILFNDIDRKKAYFNVPSDTFMIYYGEVVDENANPLCMVYCNNKLGYVDKTCLNPYNIPLNSDAISTPEIEEDTTPTDTTIAEKPSAFVGENLQIIIIVGISIICISVVYALFKPSNSKSSKNEYFEDAE